MKENPAQNKLEPAPVITLELTPVASLEVTPVGALEVTPAQREPLVQRAGIIQLGLR
jgi:hypothetical protein